MNERINEIFADFTQHERNIIRSCFELLDDDIDSIYIALNDQDIDCDLEQLNYIATGEYDE